MPFIFCLQIVLLILWFVPAVAALAPTFVFFLPASIALAVYVVVFVLAFLVALQSNHTRRRVWR